jgi:hypothetical protein
VTDLTPQQRTLRARIAVNTSWANTADRAARTQAARDASPQSRRYWERTVDPDGVLPLEERRQRAESLYRAHMGRLSYKRSRKAQAAADATATPTRNGAGGGTRRRASDHTRTHGRDHREP